MSHPLSFRHCLPKDEANCVLEMPASPHFPYTADSGVNVSGLCFLVVLKHRCFQRKKEFPPPLPSSFMILIHGCFGTADEFCPVIHQGLALSAPSSQL